jgi:DMSO/TMAO reductase YedYZ molybdopterin-dependent catalytic subunit
VAGGCVGRPPALGRYPPTMDPQPAGISREELQLAARNHGMPLEALRHEITPMGLHYLLVHYDIPAAGEDWSLRVDGRVQRPLELDLAAIRARPSVTHTVTMECAGNGRVGLEPHVTSQPWLLEAVGTGVWTGAPLAPLLEQVGLLEDAVEVVFEGLDRGLEGGDEQIYGRSLTIEQALQDGAILAYELNGAPLPSQHGYPLRLVVPGWYGMTNVKWLSSITAVSEPFAGYQQAQSYRWRREQHEVGRPVTRMMPRALMAPPGIPEFISRERTVPAGEPVAVQGRAWSGWGPIELVEFSADGGDSWWAADLGDRAGPHAWRGWSVSWQPAGAGTCELCCRATDATGATQPLQPEWNLGGYENNAVQRVPVTVR